MAAAVGGMTGLALDQRIRLDATIADGRLTALRLTTTRLGGVAGVLAAQPLAEVPPLLSRLFPLCGTAHALAGLAAIEAALGVVVAPTQRAYRDLLLLAEHGAALAWRIMMDWPPLLGAAPDAAGCAAVRRDVSALATGENWAQVGGARLRPDRAALGPVVADLRARLGALFPEAADRAPSWAGLQQALADGASVPARLIALARAVAVYGAHDRPLLPPRGADWFAARLAADPAFGSAPTCDGTPAEVGALAAGRHPLIAEALAQWGPTLATRLLAAALDVPVIVARLRRALAAIRDADPVATDPARAGQGCGVVETARGPLAYLVETADGRVRWIASAAPTEWNFHPSGPFMAALAAAPAVPDPVFAARLLAASFDPCVPFTIALEHPDRA
jgi:hypothetical protein